jgi:hypothetical protein
LDLKGLAFEKKLDAGVSLETKAIAANILPQICKK